jgi:hypothetical protein
MSTGPEGPVLADSLKLQHWLREEVIITVDLEFHTFLGEGEMGRDTGPITVAAKDVSFVNT